MFKHRSVIALAVAAVLATTMSQAPADTVAEGPAYPPPGGVNWVGTGLMDTTGGATWAYDGFDMSLFLDLWSGPSAPDGLGLSFDGTIDEPGELLEYSAADSDLAGGVARWTGSADMTLTSGPVVLPTRLTLTSAEALDFEAEAGLEGPGALVPITGDYSVHLALEAFWAGQWYPARELYNNLHQVPAAEDYVASIGFGFYYVANQAPEANITTDPETPVAEEAATLSANASDADGSVALIEWDLDEDGTYDDATGETVTHTFPQKGTYTIGVRVTDDRGLAATSSALITVVRCDEGAVSGTVHEVVEPAADTVDAGATVHDLNCATIAELGL